MTSSERQLSREERAENPVVTYEMSADESATEAVVTAVSSVADDAESDLQPLYTVIEPDALDAIFAPYRDGTPRNAEGSVTFEYGRYDVRVQSDRTVAVY